MPKAYLTISARPALTASGENAKPIAGRWCRWTAPIMIGLKARGPECVLMGYIDDASSRVYARFYEYEGTLPAMDSFKRYCLKYGLPHRYILG